jgi:nitrate reductase NapE component
LTDLQDLGYHPAFQPGPGETYQTFTATREYSRAENIATAALLTGALFPVASVATVGFVGRVYWRAATRYAGHIVLASPMEQYARHKALDTWVRRGQTALNLYTLYTHFTESPASSSSSYQQNGGAGVTKEPYPLPAEFNSRFYARTRHNPCDKGYVPRKVRGRWMCVPKSSKKSRRY